MNLKSTIIFMVFIALISNIFLHADDGDKITGIWSILDNEAHIKIIKDKNNLYQGKIIWLKEPLEDGKPKTDEENPDKKLRNRPLIGINFIYDLQYTGKNAWQNGKLYAYKKGKTLKPKISLIDINTMKVKAKIFFITKTFKWKRVIK